MKRLRLRLLLRVPTWVRIRSLRGSRSDYLASDWLIPVNKMFKFRWIFLAFTLSACCLAAASWACLLWVMVMPLVSMKVFWGLG